MKTQVFVCESGFATVINLIDIHPISNNNLGFMFTLMFNISDNACFHEDTLALSKKTSLDSLINSVCLIPTSSGAAKIPSFILKFCKHHKELWLTMKNKEANC